MDKDIQDKLDRARAAGAGAGQKIDAAKVQASKAVDHANRLITEHPVAATAAAAAAGALAAWLFPKTTRRVRKVAGKAGRAARDAAKKGATLPIEESGQLLERARNWSGRRLKPPAASPKAR